MTTILGQVRQDLELDRPGPRDPAAQQAVLAAITLDLQDPCPVVQDLRHRASIHPDLLGPEPDLPCPVARVALKAALRPDRLLLSPKSTPAPDLLPESPFGPDSGVIPGRLLPRQLDATAVAPWAAEKLNRVTIVAMKIGSLFPDLPLKTGRIFPHEGEDVPLSDYHDDLVTQPQVESLMAAKPWEILSTNSGSAISFHTDVGGRFGLFLGAYRQFETKHRMALWEGTHKFPISRPKLAKSPWLADFKKKKTWESPQPRSSRLEEDPRDLHPHYARRLVRFRSSLGSLLPSPPQAPRQGDLVPRCGIPSCELGGSDSASIRTGHPAGSLG
ncbi:hypothetical protein PC117_g19410 [Phytophthora cactorum]|uniref:Uncharacterized protein n=1 Tax=Phytophthora cactorum TaxID=29920 RepID=A0A8T1BXT4_9STRA|nr:hypothetical protein PC117_g19410 [Phytophthora cactorum]